MQFPFRLTASALALGLGLGLAVQPAAAQDGPNCFIQDATQAEAGERISPLDSASVSLGGDEAKVCYGAPSVRGREIMGELVPFDEPWRAGANEATALHLTFPATVGDLQLDPGSYSLYTIPGENSWEVVLNSEHERWGVPIDGSVRSADLGIVEVTPASTDGMVEQMRFRWDKHSEEHANLILEWENTRISVPVQKRTGM